MSADHLERFQPVRRKVHHVIDREQPAKVIPHVIVVLNEQYTVSVSGRAVGGRVVAPVDFLAPGDPARRLGGLHILPVKPSASLIDEQRRRNADVPTHGFLRELPGRYVLAPQRDPDDHARS
jgi:hypothetical protein